MQLSCIKNFCVSVNIINNLMGIHSLLVIGCSAMSLWLPTHPQHHRQCAWIVGPEFDLRPRGWNSNLHPCTDIEEQDDGRRVLRGTRTERSAPEPVPASRIYLLNGRVYGARIYSTKWSALSPILVPISRLRSTVWITGQLALLTMRLTRHWELSETQNLMCLSAQI